MAVGVELARSFHVTLSLLLVTRWPRTGRDGRRNCAGTSDFQGETMKIFGMRFAAVMTAGFLGLATLAMPTRTLAQASTPASTQASVHGHTQNAAGMALSSGEVRLTTNENPGAPNVKFDYTFPVDANGDYKGEGVKPGTYTAFLYQGDKHVDFLPVKLVTGEDKTLDFDMTRKDYLDKMTPDERAQLAEYKKKNAAANAANVKIGNLNEMLKSARAEIAAGKFDDAAKEMTDATAQRPTEAILWSTLGDAQLGQAEAAAKAAHAAKTTDASVPDKYAAAGTSYAKALAANAAEAKPQPQLAAALDNQIGVVDGKTGKTKEAGAAFDAAAAADPTKAGMYYYNEAATLFNTSDAADAAIASDKAIAADPTKADAYFIKVEGLAQGITGPVNGKFIAPPGLVDAANKYLQLAPDGPHAADMKGLLTELGEKVQTSYKAPKK
jgi:hypothetical protein